MPAESVPVILDCDPGHDDAVAILLAAASPAIELRAITTVAGNGTLEHVTRNALRVCALAGIRDVPIAAGAGRPLCRELDVASDVHGESALDGPPLPEPDIEPDPRPADEVLAAVATESDEPVTLVATGPLTNLAVLLERHPAAAARVREVVVMGGSTGRGNRTPYAEFNVWADPEAAHAVLSSGLPATMIGLNLTHQALATPDVVDRLEGLDTELARTAAAWMTWFGDSYRSIWGLPHPPVHDACAVALVSDPEIATVTHAFVAVETQGEWTRGATVVDLHGRLGRPPNVRVALDLDVPRFWDLVVGAVDALGAPAR